MKYTKIKGDVPQNVVRLPRLGKIRLGVKVKSAKGVEYPKETDYFVCPPEVQAKFGERPTRLTVMLPTEDESQMCRQYYAVYGGNQRLKCQGDGDTYERRMDDGSRTTGACPGPAECDYAKQEGKNGKPACRARIDLMVVIPDVAVGGVYQLSTGSINSDIDIRSGLAMADALYHRKSWVPMELVREPMKIADPESNKMNTHYPVKLLPVGDIQTVMAVRKDPLLIPASETSRFDVAEPQIEGPEADTPVEELADGESPDTASPVTAQTADGIIQFVKSQTSEELTRDIWRTILPDVKELPQQEQTRCTQAYLEHLKTFQPKAAAKR